MKEIIEALENVKGQLECGYIDLHDGIADEKEFNIVKTAIEIYEKNFNRDLIKDITMVTIFEKLKSIKISGGKAEIYNFEAAYILDLINDQQKEIEQCKDDILEHEKINFELYDENRNLTKKLKLYEENQTVFECIETAHNWQDSYLEKMKEIHELFKKYKEIEQVGILEVKTHEIIEEIEKIFKNN